MREIRLHPLSAACGGALIAALFLSLGMRPAPGGLSPEQFEILQHMSLVKLADGTGRNQPTLRISDLNLQLVNGSGDSATTNGRGNLILGYGETSPGLLRTGSHNFVGGYRNSHTGWGGILGGRENLIADECSSVTGGLMNAALGQYSSISGGAGGEAEGRYASIAGGEANSATENAATVAGGRRNTVTAPWGSIAGGFQNLVDGSNSSVSGGSDNVSSAATSTVTGGCNVTATQSCEVLP